VWASKAA